MVVVAVLVAVVAVVVVVVVVALVVLVVLVGTTRLDGYGFCSGSSYFRYV